MRLITKMALYLAMLLVAGFLLIQLFFFLQIWWWVDHNPHSTSFMRHRLSALRQTKPEARLQFSWLPYEQISSNLKRAIIASEDANFTEHDGINWEALQQAYEKNTRKGKIVLGGSTITQQLAKNLFLSGERSYLRKGQELIIAYMLEYWMSKKRIFEIYLNVVEWGNGIFGAEAAARHYYRISAAQLSPAQSARLAVMLPRPRFYDENRQSVYLLQRTNLILRRMGAADLP